MTVMRGIAALLLVSAVFWGVFMAASYVLWGCNPWHLIPGASSLSTFIPVTRR